MAKAKTSTSNDPPAEDTGALQKGPRVGRPQPGKAGPCPQSPSHTRTGVYRTQGRIRYCKCNDCGATWQTSGPYADPLRDFALQLVETLEAAQTETASDGAEVYVIDKPVVQEIISELKERIAA